MLTASDQFHKKVHTMVVLKSSKALRYVHEVDLTENTDFIHELNNTASEYLVSKPQDYLLLCIMLHDLCLRYAFYS